MVKEGYKQTEIGVIPEDWEVKEFKEVIELMTDYVANGSFASLKENVKVYNEPNYAMYVRLVDIRKGLGHLEQKYVDKSSYDFLSKSNLFGNEILIANIGANVGEVFLMPEIKKYATLAPNMISIRVNTDYLFSTFSFFYLKSQRGILELKRVIEGSGQEKINKTKLKNILIPLPPKQEQKVIAKVLSDTDSFISSLEELITKKEHIKIATMQQLLTGKKRLNGFNGEWVEKSIKKLVSIPVTDGPHETPNFIEKGIPFLSVNNLVDNKIDLTDLRYISKEYDLICSKKCKPQKNDILLGKAASVGKVAIVLSDFDFNIWSPIALIRIKKDYSSLYFFYSFQTENILKQIELFTNSSSQGNIGMNDIEKLKFKFPPTIEEQKAIAQILSDMDKEIEALKTKLEKVKAVKKGMMQELLTGKVRLIKGK